MNVSESFTVPSREYAQEIRDPLREWLSTARARLLLIAILIGLAFLGLAVRLIDLAMVRADVVLVEEPSRAVPEVFHRADIADRHGVLLAKSLKAASLYADPALIADPEQAARALVKLFPDLSAKELVASLSSSRRFVWIRRRLTPDQQYAVNALGIPGLNFRQEDVRVYPHGSLLAHVLGFVDIDNRGLAGLEKELDKELLRSGATPEPLRISLDLRVQNTLHEELSASVKEFKAIGGTALAMDVRNGELLGMVSLPDFDPHRASEAEATQRFNRNTLGVYEMGSTLKPLTVAMGLHYRTVSLKDGYDATKPIQYGRFKIRDYHPKERWLSVPEIFVYSSNIGSARLALDVGDQRMQKFLKNLGLFSPLTVELAEKGHPLVPSPWREIHTMTVSYGHGIAITPVHLAQAIAALVNGGVWYPASLQKGGNPDAGRRVVSQGVSRKIAQLMRLTVVNGTGSKADVPGYLVGGKTGTAEKPSSDGRYDRDARLTSFVGVFPMHEPRYLVLTMLDEPQATEDTFGYATAGWTTAPLTARIIRRIGPMLGVQPTPGEMPEVEAYQQREFRDTRHHGKRTGVRVAAY